MTPQKELRKFATRARAIGAARYFKTGPGGYGEGDIFIGVSAPDLRKVTQKYCELELRQIKRLLTSKIHEERALALAILVIQYKTNPAQVYRFYMKHLKFVNNWDLVDASAPGISGAHLYAHPELRKKLKALARSRSLWERRVAILSTFYFIRQKRHQETLQIATILLHDPHDLIHKAVGWMLRELGKRIDKSILDKFLKKNAARMPRTALRYAIERHSPAERKYWMSRTS